jgi:hypothetical protein
VSVKEPSDVVNAGMANRQRDVDLDFAQVSALRTLAWLGLARLHSKGEIVRLSERKE